MKEEGFLNFCCCDNLHDVADTAGLKVTVPSTISSAVKLTKRLVYSKRSELKTRSAVAAIRAATLRIVFSKAAFSFFHVFSFSRG